MAKKNFPLTPEGIADWLHSRLAEQWKQVRRLGEQMRDHEAAPPCPRPRRFTTDSCGFGNRCDFYEGLDRQQSDAMAKWSGINRIRESLLSKIRRARRKAKR